MKQVRSIAIGGGGLAGLAAAHGLAAFGFEVEVFEQAPSLAEIGAGINISSQAVKALCAIGLGEKLAAVANTHPVLSPAICTPGNSSNFVTYGRSSATPRMRCCPMPGRAPAKPSR